MSTGMAFVLTLPIGACFIRLLLLFDDFSVAIFVCGMPNENIFRTHRSRVLVLWVCRRCCSSMLFACVVARQKPNARYA